MDFENLFVDPLFQGFGSTQEYQYIYIYIFVFCMNLLVWLKLQHCPNFCVGHLNAHISKDLVFFSAERNTIPPI